MHESIHTLRDLLNRRRPTMTEVLGWAAGIAGELVSLHEEGCRHGDVTAENVRLAGMRARLAPGGVSSASACERDDIVQFAALLQEMLGAVELETGGERVQWGALERIAATNLRASDGSCMKKVAWALKLLRSTRPITVAERVELPCEEPAPEAGHSHHRFLMVLREIETTPEPNPKRFYAKTIHVW